MITPYSYSFLFGDLGNGVMDRDVSVNGGPWVYQVIVGPPICDRAKAREQEIFWHLFINNQALTRFFESKSW